MGEFVGALEGESVGGGAGALVGGAVGCSRNEGSSTIVEMKTADATSTKNVQNTKLTAGVGDLEGGGGVGLSVG